MEKTTLTIGGMSCGHCVKAVEDTLRDLDGVEVESVEIGRATFRFDTQKINRNVIVAAIEEEGYPVEG